MAMQNIKTLAGITLMSGTVRLKADQARSRKHLIEAVKGQEGVYRIKVAVNFKAGEAFGYDGDIPKAWVGTKLELAAANQVKK